MDDVTAFQQKQILDYLKTHKEGISSQQAISLYGITRLSDVVFKLRGKGIGISTMMVDGVNRYGRKTRYGVYRLI